MFSTISALQNVKTNQEIKPINFYFQHTYNLQNNATKNSNHAWKSAGAPQLDMFIETARLGEPFVAESADELPLPRVNDQVLVEGGQVAVLLEAVRAGQDALKTFNIYIKIIDNILYLKNMLLKNKPFSSTKKWTTKKCKRSDH